jgi:hypothetical protein
MQPTCALRRCFAERTPLAKNEDSASHARRPVRPSMNHAAPRDGTALAQALRAW